MRLNTSVVSIVCIMLCGCASLRPALDASLSECHARIPSDYQYVELSKAEEDSLWTGIGDHLIRIGRDPSYSKAVYKYWLFETPDKKAIICEVRRSKKGYEGCGPNLWRLSNDKRRVDKPDVEDGVCVIRN